MQLPCNTPVVDVARLRAAMACGVPVCLLDARCDPVNGTDPGAGRRAWLAGHLPQAQHVDLDRELSDLRKSGQGRHPLPEADDFARLLGRLGIAPAVAVVVYDSSDGALAAARAWWLLRLMGHRQVWVLDGGIDAWQAAGGPVQAGDVQGHPCAPYPGSFDDRRFLTSAQVLDRLDDAPGWLVDARAPARFSGEVEPIDPVAGHIPGAVNLPYSLMVENGRLVAPDRIRAIASDVLGSTDLQGRVLMCGSGVTACHLQLALEHAGLSGARLYPGSWSGWIDDPGRPVALGVA